MNIVEDIYVKHGIICTHDNSGVCDCRERLEQYFINWEPPADYYLG